MNKNLNIYGIRLIPLNFKLRSSFIHLTACFSFLSNSGSGFEAFVKETGELIISVFGKKEHYTVEVPDSAKTMLDGHWVRNDQLFPIIVSQKFGKKMYLTKTIKSEIHIFLTFHCNMYYKYDMELW